MITCTWGCLNELLETQKLDKFYCSNFKLDKTWARLFVFRQTLNLIKLEIFGPKLGKLISKLELKLEKWMKLELDICSNSKFWSFDETRIWWKVSSFKHYFLPLWSKTGVYPAHWTLFSMNSKLIENEHKNTILFS